MTITLPNNRWQLIGGLPVLVEGDCCVVVYREEGDREGFCYCYENGLCVDYAFPECEPFSSEHFAAAEQLLERYLKIERYLKKKRESSVKEVYRSEYVTVYRRDDGEEAIVAAGQAYGEWCWNSMERVAWVLSSPRDKAEAGAKRVLMEGK